MIANATLALGVWANKVGRAKARERVRRACANSELDLTELRKIYIEVQAAADPSLDWQDFLGAVGPWSA